MKKRTLVKTTVFSQDIKKVPQPVQLASWEIAQKLAEDVFYSGLSIKKLIGYLNIWRVVVVQDYRLVYSFDENSVFLLRIAHRKDIYRKNFNFDF